MDSDDSEKTPAKGTPKPTEVWTGVLPDVPPSACLPMPGKVWAGRKSQPPPVPEGAKRTQASAPRAPPPIPETVAGDPPGESTNPSMRTVEQRQKTLLGILRSFYPEDLRVGLNGNAKPALKLHVDQMRDRLAMDIEAETRYFFIIPMKWVAVAATALALASGGLAIHSCVGAKDAKEQIEIQKKEIQELKKQLQQEKQKTEPKKVNFYIPKALRTSPQIPNRIPQRIARNSLRA